MNKHLLLLIICLSALPVAYSQTIAQKRADSLGLGMNLSYLDNYWLGSKEKNYSDFADADEVARREKTFADISRAGFQTVRLPINFGVWATIVKPYRWKEDNGLRHADNFVNWSLKNNLRTIIDLHHVETDRSNPAAASTERLVWLWTKIARRYQNTDPDRVFFEIRNEPHDMPAVQWREQAAEIIKAIRLVAPKHTLIVGFHDWNSRAALIDSKPFADDNVIYTFHYYDPFIFTHQGATWAGEGLPELKNVPFPFSPKTKIETPETAEGNWVGELIKSYKEDSSAEKMFADLKVAKDWSKKYNVPIFLGEFGSFSKSVSPADRCRHAEVIYSSLGKLDIPSAWWEWDGGFNMFGDQKDKLSGCMQKAVDSYISARKKY